MRKAIQINTAPYANSILTTLLFDDGTVWSKLRNSTEWCQVDLPPETETKEPPLPDSDGWVKHDGGEMPESLQNQKGLLRVIFSDGSKDHNDMSFARLRRWKHRGLDGDITFYLVENYPEPEYTPSEWPEGAEWWAVDQNQSAYFYRSEARHYQLGGGFGGGVHSQDKNYIKNTIKDWKTSLRKRPEAK